MSKLKTTKLVLIRHGQTEHNAAGLLAGWTDSALSNVGQGQAVRMAAYVSRQYRLDYIYASPLQRARHTAEAIGRLTGHVATACEGLKEVNFGLLEGLTHEEATDRYPDIWRASRALSGVPFVWPGGEAFDAFFERVSASVSEIVARHPGKTVALVTHGGAIGAFVADLVEGYHLFWERYVPRNCSVTEIHASVEDSGQLAPRRGPSSVARPEYQIHYFNHASFLFDDLRFDNQDKLASVHAEECRDADFGDAERLPSATSLAS